VIGSAERLLFLHVQLLDMWSLVRSSLVFQTGQCDLGLFIWWTSDISWHCCLHLRYICINNDTYIYIYGS